MLSLMRWPLALMGTPAAKNGTVTTCMACLQNRAAELLRCALRNLSAHLALPSQWHCTGDGHAQGGPGEHGGFRNPKYITGIAVAMQRWAAAARCWRRCGWRGTRGASSTCTPPWRRATRACCRPPPPRSGRVLARPQLPSPDPGFGGGGVGMPPPRYASFRPPTLRIRWAA